ncbi:mannose-6-phosphate isomerase [Streptomyces rimosus subsp. pseudoverticillatus]|uniref:SIS domain-containing protein n=1 Tax=Streptomyces rimosus TaxID=1927 RepID=UPI0006B2A20B|nr:SIS domain-containing protein [Streptomyces rimosus]KOT79920.1 mannose-6-phosphate isomerase [Streptomyces rimosus subsp. pseudoverticillatus]
MLDESLLDAPEALAGADRFGLLRGVAESGARVRTAARNAAESGITDLRPDGRPRTVLVAGPGPAAACVADLFGALGGGSCPVTLIRPTGVAPRTGALRWTLPGWSGPLDLLLITAPDGSDPALAQLVEQAYRRGCSIVAVSPAGGPLADAVVQARGLTVPLATTPYDAEFDVEGAPPAAPGTLWSLLTPLLALADRIGLLSATPEALAQLADRLDQVAERCGPAVGTYSNPAKTLAAELADALPLIWTEGLVAGAVGRHFATVLAGLAGRPALAGELPETMTTHGALLAGPFAAGADPDDFFRDRVDQPTALHARVVLLREEQPGPLSAAPAARDLVLEHDTPVSELEPDDGSDLEKAAELLAITDFAAVYLGLAGTKGS